MSPRPCAVFDLDGTLVDSLEAIVLAVSGTLETRGGPVPAPAEITAHMGMGLPTLFRWATGLEAPEALEPLVRETRDRYRRLWRARTRVFPGIPEMLGELRSRGVVLAVLSNKGHESTVEVTEGLFPPGTFAAVHGLREGWPGKPSPAGLLRILGALDAAPDAAFMVGDMAVDVRTGRAAGVRTAGVCWGFQGPAAFDGAPPDVLVRHPAEIPRLFPGRLQ